jgi:hypothetical protein
MGHCVSVACEGKATTAWDLVQAYAYFFTLPVVGIIIFILLFIWLWKK